MSTHSLIQIVVGISLALHLCHLNSHAQNSDGVKIFSLQEVTKALKLAAEGKGDPAYVMYWQCVHESNQYRFPKGVDPADVLRAAAVAGVPEAQCSYYSYLIKSPERKTREDAIYWLRAAAAQGHPPAIQSIADHPKVLELAEKREAAKKNRESKHNP